MHFFLFLLSVCVFLLGDMFHNAISKKVNGNFRQEYHDLVLESGMVEDYCSILFVDLHKLCEECVGCVHENQSKSLFIPSAHMTVTFVSQLYLFIGHSDWTH